MPGFIEGAMTDKRRVPRQTVDRRTSICFEALHLCGSDPVLQGLLVQRLVHYLSLCLFGTEHSDLENDKCGLVNLLLILIGQNVIQ